MLHLTIGSKFDLELIQRIFSNHGNIEISFYGAPPNFVLDGGRIVMENIENFYSSINFFKKAEIQFNLCCNSVLNPNEININKEFYDLLANLYSPLNGIIVSRHWMADKIKKRFPNFKYIFSSIGILTEKWDEDYIFSSYDIVVCPVQYTKNFKFLSDPNNYSKLEVFINNECIGFNTKCINHYRHNSEINSGLKRESEFMCPNIKLYNNSLKFSVYDLLKYVELGVRNFKVIERTSTDQNYQYYIDLLAEVNNHITATRIK